VGGIKLGSSQLNNNVRVNDDRMEDAAVDKFQ
jgi:hypothetical protein